MRLALDFQLHDAPLDLVNFRGKRIDLHAQSGGRFVHQVNRLVGKEPIRDVALRKHRRRDDGGVLDAHAVMHFVAFFQAAQNRDGIFHGRLADHHRLEAALERRILLDIFAVFVQRGGADRAQLAASQRGLQHVRGVHRAFGRARADQGVQFVDEKNDLAVGFGNFLQHSLQTVFEFAAIFRAGDERCQVERHQALRLQNLGNVSCNDSLREAFGNCGFAHAGFADQHGIILRAPGENLHHAADFFVAADHGIELAAPREVRQIAGILLDGAIG